MAFVGRKAALLSENLNNLEEKMASNPEVRVAMLGNLMACDAPVRGSSFGQIAAQLAPPDVSHTQAKRALNSLAYSTKRPRSVRIVREQPDRGMGGVISVRPLGTTSPPLHFENDKIDR